jgi:transposase InsO family protein
MCKVLKVSRSLIYYKYKTRVDDCDIEEDILKIFKESRNNYGQRKIKKELAKSNIIASRRRISRVMRNYGLVSNYTKKQYKKHNNKVNNDNIINELNREFNTKKHMEVITSDLTYVNVSGRWHYICLMINLFNREIVGYSVGSNKDADLVLKAFSKIKENIKNTRLFHSDRGAEYKNSKLEKILKENNIKRSLSKKGCPFDNAVSESTYKIIKTEFAYERKFVSQEELDLELFDYVNWYNNKRLHGTLGYMSPKEFREVSLTKLSK